MTSKNWGAAVGITALSLVALTLFLLVFIALNNWLKPPPDLNQAVLVIGGVESLIVAIVFVAIALAVIGVGDKTQALGMPEGSVRALIAILLIVLFGVAAIYFYHSIDPTARTDFAKQVVTVLGTLVTSIAGFYFGSRTAESAAAGALVLPGSVVPPAPGGITIGTVLPATVSVGVARPLQITGTNLNLVTGVELRSGAETPLVAKDLRPSPTWLTCTVDFANAKAGLSWEVVLTIPGGTYAKPSALQT